MTLPESLKTALETELSGIDLVKTRVARESLSASYKSPFSKQHIIEEAHRQAYLAARMPATYEAVASVLHQINLVVPGIKIDSFLDMGAGPGTASWAATETLHGIEKVTLLEQDQSLIAVGKKLAMDSESAALRNANWQHADLTKLEEVPVNDLILFSYSIGELTENTRLELLKKSWAAANKLLVIIEPGTTAGFERIRQMRSELINLGAHMVAPCPHIDKCPMTDGNWCHFSARVERTSLHRKIKGGALGHEDEKFSYIAFSKTVCKLPDARILRHPQKRSGHIAFSLCTPRGLENKVLSKRDPELYKIAKKLEWGDTLP